MVLQSFLFDEVQNPGMREGVAFGLLCLCNPSNFVRDCKVTCMPNSLRSRLL